MTTDKMKEERFSIKMYGVVLNGFILGDDDPRYANNHRSAYVIAENADEAYDTVCAELDKRGIGHSKEREIDFISLVAEYYISQKHLKDLRKLAIKLLDMDD